MLGMLGMLWGIPACLPAPPYPSPPNGRSGGLPRLRTARHTGVALTHACHNARRFRRMPPAQLAAAYVALSLSLSPLLHVSLLYSLPSPLPSVPAPCSCRL